MEKIKINKIRCNKCGDEINPYKRLNRDEILKELADSRQSYEIGKGEDFDKAIDEIGVKYGL